MNMLSKCLIYYIELIFHNDFIEQSVQMCKVQNSHYLLPDSVFRN